jgi:hypothetical protein
MKVFLTLINILAFVSCAGRKDKIDPVRYLGIEQLLTVNDVDREGGNFVAPEISKLSQDSVVFGEELVVKIFLDREDLHVLEAFVDCQTVPNPAVDTTTYSVTGCSNRLIVQNDTIFIGFRPPEPGIKKFPAITILTRDREKIFRTFTYSFDYKVVKGAK